MVALPSGYRNIVSVLDTHPTGSGGQLLNWNFRALADGVASGDAHYINGIPILSNVPTSGAVLKYNNTGWVATTTDASGNITTHSQLAGLSADDHTQYVKADGTRAFTAAVGGVAASAGSHLARLDQITPTQVGSGSPYWNATSLWGKPITSTAPTYGYILQWNGSAWAPSGVPLGSGGGGGVTDHGALTGLTDDDHTQYMLVNAGRGFSAAVSGVAGSAGYHLVIASTSGTPLWNAGLIQGKSVLPTGNIPDEMVMVWDSGAGKWHADYTEKSFTFTLTKTSIEEWDNNTIPVWQAPRTKNVVIKQINATAMTATTDKIYFNLQKRAYGSLNSVGTNIFGATSTASGTGSQFTSFAVNVIEAKSHLMFVTGASAAASGTPTTITVTIYYAEY